jgi:hypothetical protein
MTLDDRPVRADYDWGFKEGRQFGRGRSGGQVSIFEGFMTCVDFTTDDVRCYETTGAL